MRLLAAVVLAGAFTASPAAATPSVPYWQTKHCDHGFPSKVGYHRTTRLLKNHRPLTPQTKRAVRGFVRCQETRAKARSVQKHVRWLRRWRMRYEHRWPIVFNRLPASDRAWAVATSTCEAHMNPATNTGNGFYGAFQFMVGTWHSAGGTGYPNQHSWHYQAVIAVRWMHIAGAGQWPVCG